MSEHSIAAIGLARAISNDPEIWNSLPNGDCYRISLETNLRRLRADSHRLKEP